MTHPTRLATLLLATLLLAPALPAQVFEGATRVIEVQVPVNVFDKRGEPVRGLTVDDFEILEGKEKQRITGFQVVDLDLVEPGISRVEIERALPASARRHFLLLFDLSFSSPVSVVRARKAARKFVLENLHPTDLVAVATHSVESGTRLLVTFTPDRAQVARAIDTLGAPRLVSLTRQDPLHFLIEDPIAAAAGASPDVPDLTDSGPINDLQQSLIGHIRVVAKQMEKMEKSFARGRIFSWASSFGELARFMDSIRGRKHIIYFSEGFDGRLLLGRQPAADRQTLEDLRNLQSGNVFMVDTDDFYGNTGLQADMAIMLEEFRKANCVIQAVDISGLTAGSLAEERARGVGRDALFYIANETGGALLEDANDFGSQLDRVLTRSNLTYLLSFQPAEVEPDGSFHRIKVRANVPRGTRITARHGYYAPRPYDELHPLEKGLLAADAIASASPVHDLGLNVLAAPFRASVEQAYVPIIIEASGEDLLEGHGADSLPIEFYAYVTNKHGEMKDFFTQMVTLDLSSQRDGFRSTGIKYYGHLDLGPGEYLVRVLVRNAHTGRSGLKTLPVDVPAYDQARPFVLPPFFLEAAGSWFLVREKGSAGYQRSVVYPFTVNGEPYIPAARPALSRRHEARLCLVAYNLGQGEPLLDGTIVSEDGRVVDGASLLRIERTITGIEGLDKFLATFRPEGLEAGSYRLQIAVTDPDTGLTESSEIPFTLLN